ncbi:MAG TPA: hypothetical protein VL689_07280 [Paraburkholderia sp.]|jgi:hypothetical protein|nr:hypothetical protein [Paraburkholderia sp.]
MATLARRCAKVILILGLFFVSIRYIYNPLSFLFSWNQRYLFIVSEMMGITGSDNIEFFDALFSLTVSSIIAGALYLLLVMLCRFFRARSHDSGAGAQTRRPNS